MTRYLQISEEQYTTIVAALALAAQQYADPSPVYDAIETLAPGTSIVIQELIEGRDETE